MLETAVTAAYTGAAPATWNRVLATLGSFLDHADRQGWLPDGDLLTARLDRRRPPADHTRALDRAALERLSRRGDVGLREKTLWRLLYETAARAQEILTLDVEDLDLANKRARVVRKGGDVDWVFWQSGSAQLLPRLIGRRRRGPLFLATRPPTVTRTPASLDLDPHTGRARLSYRRTAELFTAATGATLHQLRHSALTHLAEDGVDVVTLMAKSRHASLRTLHCYARPGREAVAALTAAHDPTARPRGQ